MIFMQLPLIVLKRLSIKRLFRAAAVTRLFLYKMSSFVCCYWLSCQLPFICRFCSGGLWHQVPQLFQLHQSFVLLNDPHVSLCYITLYLNHTITNSILWHNKIIILIMIFYILSDSTIHFVLSRFTFAFKISITFNSKSCNPIGRKAERRDPKRNATNFKEVEHTSNLQAENNASDQIFIKQRETSELFYVN